MSGSQQKPWSDSPNAPTISYHLYFHEKTWFAGGLVTSVLYGITVVIFFKCMAALFNPDYRRGDPIKWRLVSFTVAMFSLVTIGIAMQLSVQSIYYIDRPGFPGVENTICPGPTGCQWLIEPEPVTVIHNSVFALSNWLAEGLLLHRCYVVYSMNLWAIAFPCLMFLGSIAMGIGFVYQDSQVSGALWSSLPYYSISLSLNVLLTLITIIRLILYARNTRTALGIIGIGGLCKAIIMMLVESCALFSANSLLIIGLLAAGNAVSGIFMATIGEIRAIASLLLILRVANKSAFVSNTVASGRIDEFKTRSRGESADSGALPGGDDASPADERVMNTDESVVGVATGYIDPHQARTQGSPNPDNLHG